MSYWKALSWRRDYGKPQKNLRITINYLHINLLGLANIKSIICQTGLIMMMIKKIGRIVPSGMWQYAVWYKLTDTSEECTISIFRVKESAKEPESRICLKPLILKMVTVCSSETSINFYHTIKCHNPEDSQCHENLKVTKKAGQLLSIQLPVF
jgi:hypothetical protein